MQTARAEIATCPCCCDDMDTRNVVCWTCYRLSNRLSIGTFDDGEGGTFTLTADDVARYDAERALRITRCGN